MLVGERVSSWEDSSFASFDWLFNTSTVKQTNVQMLWPIIVARWKSWFASLMFVGVVLINYCFWTVMLVGERVSSWEDSSFASCLALIDRLLFNTSTVKQTNVQMLLPVVICFFDVCSNSINQLLLLICWVMLPLV
jgi:hypothetical protein